MQMLVCFFTFLVVGGIDSEKHYCKVTDLSIKYHIDFVVRWGSGVPFQLNPGNLDPFIKMDFWTVWKETNPSQSCCCCCCVVLRPR